MHPSSPRRMGCPKSSAQDQVSQMFIDTQFCCPQGSQNTAQKKQHCHEGPVPAPHHCSPCFTQQTLSRGWNHQDLISVPVCPALELSHPSLSAMAPPS